MAGDPISGKSRIRESCFDLVLDEGLAAATPAAIAERAGVDEAAFHEHYRDAEDCILDLYGQIRDEMFSRVDAEVRPESGDWLEQMRALVLAMVDFLTEDERRARFLVVEIVHAGDRVRVAREADLRRLSALVAAGDGEFGNSSKSEDLAMSVAGTCFLQVHKAVLQGELENAYRAIPEMLYFIVLPYRGEEAAQAELLRPAPRPG